MNFFKIIFLVIFATFSFVAIADNHDLTETSADQTVSSSEMLDDEEVPLNDPFAGDASTASDIVTEETPTSSAVKLRAYKLVGSFSAQDNSFITLVDDNGEFMTVELFEEVLSGVKLVNVNIKEAVFEKADDNKYIIMNFKNQIKEANEY